MGAWGDELNQPGLHFEADGHSIDFVGWGE